MRIFKDGLDSLIEEINSQAGFMFDNAEEIGSSDISCCVLNVLGIYYGCGNHKMASDSARAAVRNGVMNYIKSK